MCERVNNSAAVLQAATDGRGVVLARRVLAIDDVSAGRLILLIPKVKLAPQPAHYLVYRAESSSLPKSRLFANG
ncbi:LysR substrate-binding domain-containing protein [Dyella humicola]|uniref:LysR substrate-binding domain-containing protein n=1 Tax=Dyella humicola TaxID=2992126 RepID=UPI0022556EED|nr:LysR substrate-binding domain-containing protein [Dyella humicola]